MRPDGEQTAIRATIMRGGTSKAVFVDPRELPPPGEERERILRRVVGSQDVSEVDGLGAGTVNTSKIAIVGPPSVADADVDYTAGEVGLGDDVIHYENNCGNMSAAVGPYAIEAKLMPPRDLVRIYNTNTKRIVFATIPLTDEGRPRVRGDYHMVGLHGTGAPIFLDFRLGAGAMTGRLLPSGQPRDDWDDAAISIVDLACLCVMVEAGSLGITGGEAPRQIEQDAAVMARVRALHDAARARVGLPALSHPSGVPYVVALSAPVDATADIRVRVFGLGHCHPTIHGTVAVNVAAACVLGGTIPHALLGGRRTSADAIMIEHARGVIPIDLAGEPPNFSRLGYYRTARKLMEGEIFIPAP